MNQLYVFPLVLFQNGVVHRDLKLENVLLDENHNIKVLELLAFHNRGERIK